jgi:acyl carrier protein
MNSNEQVMNDTLSPKELALIQNVLVEELEVKREQITPEARLIEDLGADSLSVIEIVMHLEEIFNITVPDEEVENAPTVEDLYSTVAKLVRHD